MKDLENLINFNSLENIDEFIVTIDNKKVFGMDENFTPYHFKNLCIKNDIITYNFENPCLYPKAIKNVIELNGARNANIRDGISISQYLFWLKTKSMSTYSGICILLFSGFNKTVPSGMSA